MGIIAFSWPCTPSLLKTIVNVIVFKFTAGINGSKKLNVLQMNVGRLSYGKVQYGMAYHNYGMVVNGC